MKNIIARIGVHVMASMLMFGCAGQSKEKSVKTENADIATIQKQQNDSSMLSTIELDGMKVTWIRDNANDKVMPLSLFPNATKAQIDSLFLQDGVPASISTFLVEKDGKQILFDTGMGAPDSKLPEGLKSLNINTADIDYIFITHFHGDHIGGMMKDGIPIFPNAEVYVSKAEYDAWMKMPADKKSQVASTMKAYKARLHQFSFGDTLPCNVVAMEAAGHTPGHTVFQTGKLLVIGDLMHGAALQLKYPEICAIYDMDKSGAVKTRKHYMQYAREKGLVIAGMHLPAPAFMK